jgi:hypothetical protein
MNENERKGDHRDKRNQVCGLTQGITLHVCVHFKNHTSRNAGIEIIKK